ncbi:hypothetical protein [Gimesia sp.]|uniref:hypothetical protein n=1 Tax=Gimesia sp. TaxID=2024833 RepID=UPI003A8D3D34
MLKESSNTVMPNNQNFLQWAWNNEPWLLVLIAMMFWGMITSFCWIAHRIRQ